MILFLTFIWFNLFSQTKYDSLLFEKINEYRVSKGLNELIWDNDLFKASEHHSNYLVNLNKIPNDTVYENNDMWILLGHAENKNVRGIKKLKSPTDRTKYYLKGDVFVGENVFFASILKMNEFIVDQILKNWISSKLHNEFLLNENIKYGSNSIIEYEYYYVNSFNTLVTDIDNINIYVTFNGYW